MATGEPPLVIITTNEERSLPDAFLRRCLVLHMGLPKAKEALIARLVTRAAAHFEGRREISFDKEVATKAAELLWTDRAQAEREHWRPLPGQAEYLDLVRAVVTLAPDDVTKQAELLDEVARFALRKHPGATA
ncbi:MAG: hypothetical protein WCF85_16340 [Rhodospirillaceae bacterium]